MLGMRTSTYNFDLRIDKDYNVYLMEVAPRDGGNYIPQVINYASGVNLVEYSIRAAMGGKKSARRNSRPLPDFGPITPYTVYEMAFSIM